MSWSMYCNSGQRKYLTKSETTAFLNAARKSSPEVYTFCWFIAASGCRISEALAITARNVDFEAQMVVIECLKKRGRQVFRSVPLPAKLLNKLRLIIEIHSNHDGRMWPWSRMTGYRRICEIMNAAGLEGPHATPKGLRHGFGVAAVQVGVPLNLVQRWLGHADIKTTAIYTSASGPEERAIASRMWVNSPKK